MSVPFHKRARRSTATAIRFRVKSNADIAAQAMWQDIKPEKTAANIRRGGVRKRQSTGASIRNEDATHIMFLVTKELKLRQTKITKNLTSIIESIIAMDTTGTDIEKLKTQIATIEDKRTKLIDIYMSGDISKDEFSAARSKCDTEIAELQSVIDSIDKQQAMIRQQQELVQEIRDAINEIVCGVEYDDEFYKHILDKMVVNDKDNIDVYLNLLPMKWSYTVAKASKKALAPERNISGASVPISVSNPATSLYGMEYLCERYLIDAPSSPSGPPYFNKIYCFSTYLYVYAITIQ